MTTIRFHSTTKYFLSLSILLVLAAVGMLIFFQKGFRTGIEFSPGLSVQFHLSRNVSVEELEPLFEEGAIPSFRLRRVGNEINNDFLIRIADDRSSDFQNRIQEMVLQILTEKVGTPQVEEVIFIETGLSQVLRFQTIILVLITFILILGYLWFRFHIHYAIAAIIATLHDVVFITLFIGASGIELSASTVAAVLTIIGYSLNDTIVVFDRIRENISLLRHSRVSEIIDTSINQSLSRTIVTSFTTLIAVSAIIVLATGGVRDFAITLGFGVVVGTYSSIFIAAPVLYLFRRRLQTDKAKQKKSETQDITPSEASSPKSKTATLPVAQHIDVQTLKREMGWRKKPSRKKG